jgi:hypothetical protein
LQVGRLTRIFFLRIKIILFFKKYILKIIWINFLILHDYKPAAILN